MRSPLLTAIIICIIVGMAGGLVVTMVVPASLIINILLGALYGLLFALLTVPRAINPGSGLLWGLGYVYLGRLARSRMALALVAGPLLAFGSCVASFNGVRYDHEHPF